MVCFLSFTLFIHSLLFIQNDTQFTQPPFYLYFYISDLQLIFLSYHLFLVFLEF